MMEADENRTHILRAELERCGEADEVRELLWLRQTWFEAWPQLINRLMEDSGLSYNRLAVRCGVSKNSLRHWCCSPVPPRSRDTYIKLGFGFDMDAARTDRLLTRYGGYSRLHPRELFDAVCIYLLDQGGRTWADAMALYQRCGGIGVDGDGGDGEGVELDGDGDGGVAVAAGGAVSPDATAVMRHGLSTLDTDAAFCDFAATHAELFGASYVALNAQLRACLLRGQLADEGRSVRAALAEQGLPPRR